MGEIAVSCFAGGWMVLIGAVMLVCLNKEEKRYREEEKSGNYQN